VVDGFGGIGCGSKDIRNGRGLNNDEAGRNGEVRCSEQIYPSRRWNPKKGSRGFVEASPSHGLLPTTRQGKRIGGEKLGIAPQRRVKLSQSVAIWANLMNRRREREEEGEWGGKFGKRILAQGEVADGIEDSAGSGGPQNDLFAVDKKATATQGKA